MTYEEKNTIYEKAKRIVDSDLNWRDKFDMIFSEEISLKFDFEWFDPDMDYEDDVKAFMSCFDEYMENQKIINEQIDL